MTAAVTIRNNGFTEMAYVGEKPWHGLGQELKPGQSIDEWKIAAGMDWTACRSRVRFGEGDNQRIFDEHHVIFRSDTKKPLGVVGQKFQLVQPGEVLEFFRDLTNGNGYELNTAGTLFDGRRFWALARVTDDAVVIGNDRVKSHLLLCTAIDGSMKTTAKYVAERVVCKNTLTIALKENTQSFSMSHRTTFDPLEMKKQLGVVTGSFREFMLETRRLASKPITTQEAEQFIGEALVENNVVSAKEVTNTTAFKKIRELFVDGTAMGAELEGVDGTLWGLVNGITEYVDHHAKSKTPSHQLDNALFGRGDAFKSAALRKALALV
jgi:phage/plasmid-like protein (TIGR03299 family)